MTSSPRAVRHAGALVLGLAVVLGAWLVIGSGRWPWQRRVPVAVAFDHVGALKVGATVRLAGRAVGAVVEIGPSRPGEARSWRVVAEIEAGALRHIAGNSQAVVTPQGVLGKPMLEIVPPVGVPLAPLANMKAPTLTGVDPPTLDRTLARLDRHAALMLEVRAQLGPPWGRLERAWANLTTTLVDLGLSPDGPAARRWAKAAAVVAYGREVAPSVGEARDALVDANVAWAAMGPSLIGRGDALVSLWVGRRARLDDADREALVKIGALLRRGRAVIGQFAALREAVMELLLRAEDGTARRILNDPELYDLFKMFAAENSQRPWRLIGHPDDQSFDREAWRKQFDVPAP